MTEWNTDQLIDWDKRFVWHPFTNMPEWCAPGNQPLVLVEGNGALLRDSQGREYIDGNSSIWTNIHGATAEQGNCREKNAREGIPAPGRIGRKTQISHASHVGDAKERPE